MSRGLLVGPRRNKTFEPIRKDEQRGKPTSAMSAASTLDDSLRLRSSAHGLYRRELFGGHSTTSTRSAETGTRLQEIMVGYATITL